MRGHEYADLRAFIAVAESSSFTRAASRLGLSPSVLSQIIRRLEDRLAVRLLNRTTRSVGLSEAGARLLQRIRPAISDLDAALDEASTLSGSVSGRVRINATRIAAVHCLAPLIGPFQKAHPGVSLEIVVEDKLVDIVAERFDAGVRLGESVDKDMVAVKLGGEIEMMVVGSPVYFEQYGRPRSPRDLKRHRCINFLWPTSGGLYRWEFERGDEKLEASVDGPLIVNDPQVAARAAVDGVGLAYLFEYDARPLIESGRLVRVLKEWSPPFPGFFLYHPSRRQTPAPLRALIDFITTRSSGDRSRR